MGNIGHESSQQQFMQELHQAANNALSPESMSDRGLQSPREPGHSPDQRSHRTESEGPSDQAENYTPRRGHAYKRHEDPPRNEYGKMICKFADTTPECRSVTFDRKCEWSKHMDKHDRPYKCGHKGCEKLQGFTYSGGLLRHEREVHKLHGGTKKALFCPHPDCKRSMGDGFTRKENLAEHIRRVHRTASGSTDHGGMPMDQGRPSIIGRIEESPDVEEPGTELLDPALRKRKRPSVALVDRTDRSHDDTGDVEASDLRAEVKRLRAENEEKDDRLRRLEAVVAKLEQQQNGVVVS